MRPPLAPVVLDRVSFVVAGTQKSGTQALDQYLREHLELCMPRFILIGTMSADEKQYLIGVYEQEIHELERLLGWDCSAWLR